MSNIKRGVQEDYDNRFRNLPFWLRIGPINWKFNECPYGWMLPNYNDYAED